MAFGVEWQLDNKIGWHFNIKRVRSLFDVQILVRSSYFNFRSLTCKYQAGLKVEKTRYMNVTHQTNLETGQHIRIIYVAVICDGNIGEIYTSF